MGCLGCSLALLKILVLRPEAASIFQEVWHMLRWVQHEMFKKLKSVACSLRQELTLYRSSFLCL